MNKNLSNVVFSISYFSAAIIFFYLIYSVFSSSGVARDVSGLALMLISLAALDGLKVSRFYSKPTAEEIFYPNEMIASGWYFSVVFLCCLYINFGFSFANIYSYGVGFIGYKLARLIFIKSLARIMR